MSISRVGSNSANGDSVTLPTHAAGDMIIIAAYRSGSSAGITVPSGWTVAQYRTATNESFVVCYRQCTTNSHTSGTFTSATQVAAVTYRHSSNLLQIEQTSVSSANSAALNYAAIAGTAVGTDQWYVGVGATVSNATAAETAPSGMTNVTAIAGASVGELAIHDTSANVSSWSATSVAITSGIWASAVIGVCDSGIAKSAAARPAHPMYQQVIG